NVPYNVTIILTSNDPRYNFDPPDVALINLDNDTPGFQATPQSGLRTTEAGGGASFTVRLATRPRFDVIIPVICNDTTEGLIIDPRDRVPRSRIRLTFTPNTNTAGGWNVEQTVRVVGIDDPERVSFQDGTQPYTVSLGAASSTDPAYGSRFGPTVSLVNLDLDDESPPVLAMTFPAAKPNNAYRSPRVFNGSVSDAGTGVRQVLVSLFRFANPEVGTTDACLSSNGTFVACNQASPPQLTATLINVDATTKQWQITTPVLTRGIYRIQATAVDNGGLRSPTITRFFVVDSVAPTITVTSPTANAIVGELSTITGRAVDNISGSGVKSVSVVLFREANETFGTTAGFLTSSGTFTGTETAANQLPAVLTPGTIEPVTGLPRSVDWTFEPGVTLTPGQYFFEVLATDAASNTRRTSRTGFFLRNVGEDEFIVGQTYLISVPFMNTSDINGTTTPAEAFTVPPTSIDKDGNLILNYELRRFNAVTQEYERLTNTSIIRRHDGLALQPIGRGTRILRPTDDPARKPLATLTEYPILLRRNTSSTAASNGFNLIGFPYDPTRIQSIDFLNAKVIHNGTTFNSVRAAQAAGIISDKLFVIDPVTGGVVLKGDTIMEPFGGYFVRVFADNVTLVLQPVAPVPTP
ncbi:MAG: hypothetical protein M3347_13470, partial [Armatimonadota bacterium]|nr:hypothetical protein [Armatimonadota bacterium]